jgi:hypothetical protein
MTTDAKHQHHDEAFAAWLKQPIEHPEGSGIIISLREFVQAIKSSNVSYLAFISGYAAGMDEVIKQLNKSQSKVARTLPNTPV